MPLTAKLVAAFEKPSAGLPPGGQPVVLLFKRFAFRHADALIAHLGTPIRAPMSPASIEADAARPSAVRSP